MKSCMRGDSLVRSDSVRVSSYRSLSELGGAAAKIPQRQGKDCKKISHVFFCFTYVAHNGIIIQ